MNFTLRSELSKVEVIAVEPERASSVDEAVIVDVPQRDSRRPQPTEKHVELATIEPVVVAPQ